MSEDKKKTDGTEETSEVGRREFLTKAVAAAGALAAGGLLASALSGDAEAQTIKAAPIRATPIAMKPELVGNAPLKYAKLAKGHELSVEGKELSEVLAREGLIANDLAGRNAVMSLKLEWS